MKIILEITLPDASSDFVPFYQHAPLTPEHVCQRVSMLLQMAVRAPAAPSVSVKLVPSWPSLPSVLPPTHRAKTDPQMLITAWHNEIGLSAPGWVERAFACFSDGSLVSAEFGEAQLSDWIVSAGSGTQAIAVLTDSEFTRLYEPLPA